MDDKYFDVDYESTSDYSTSDGERKQPNKRAPKMPKSALKKPTEDSFERFARSTKRVKFDNSPIDTPSKLRAEREYDGVHFSETPNLFVASNEDSDFVPTPHHPAPGTFCLPDRWSDESSEESSGMSDVQYQSDLSISNFSPLEQSTPLPQYPPVTPKKGNEEISPLSRARNSALKYQPKSPSILRQATRVASSSPLVMEEKPVEKMVEKAEKPAEKAQEKVVEEQKPEEKVVEEEKEEEEEEENEFSRLPWPEPISMVDAGLIDQEVAELVNFLWRPEDDIRAEQWFDREFARFVAAREAA